MSDQSEYGTMGGSTSGSGTSQSEAAMQDTSVVPGGQGGVTAPGHSATATGPYPSYHGRTVSWVAVAIMVVGFILGGMALVFAHGGPTWWLFWTGVGVTALGLLVSFATNMFEDWY